MGAQTVNGGRDVYERSERYTVNIVPDVGYEVRGEWQDDIHHIRTRMVFDYNTYQVLEAEAEEISTPFSICNQGIQSIKNLVGEPVTPGFSKLVNQKVAGKEGCIHVAEMVLNSVRAGLQGASRNIPEWVDDQDYANRWSNWELLYKDKCIYWSQPDAYKDSMNKIRKTLDEK